MYSRQFSVCSVQCTVCSVQCAVCSVKCAVFSVQCAVCSVQCAVLVCSVQGTLCSVPVLGLWGIAQLRPIFTDWLENGCTSQYSTVQYIKYGTVQYSTVVHQGLHQALQHSEICLLLETLNISKIQLKPNFKNWVYYPQFGSLQCPWRSLLKDTVTLHVSFHNMFAFGEYVHVHSVVFNVWSVKCSQITRFNLKIHALGPQINPCYGYSEHQ